MPSSVGTIHGSSRADGASVEASVRHALVGHAVQSEVPASPPIPLPWDDVPPVALPPDDVSPLELAPFPASPAELPPADVPPVEAPPVELPPAPRVCAPLEPPNPPSAPPAPAPDWAASFNALEAPELPHEHV